MTDPIKIRTPGGDTIFAIRQTPKFFGCRIAIHSFENADEPGCFHTHPAWAFRLVLWGGYVEEVQKELAPGRYGRYFKRWFPGRFGIIKPSLDHRIDSLMNGRSSISLWIRGPVVAPINARCD